MPDTFSVSLMIIGLYYIYRYSVNGKLVHLFLYILFSSLGSLSKLPSLMFVSLLALPIFSKKINAGLKTGLTLAGITVIALTALWYTFWVPHLVDIYKNRLYFPVSIYQGISELIQNLPETLERFYFSSLHSFVALACFLSGLLLLARKGPPLLARGFILLTLLFGGYMIKAGRIFSMHDYYIIPYTPLMALVAGYALSSIKPWARNIVLVIIVLEGVANQHQDFFIKESERYKLDLEIITDKVSNRDDLIIINIDGNPQELYFAHRKGWNIPGEKLEEKGVLFELKEKGAKYLFINRSRGDTRLVYPVVYQDAHYTVYNLK